MLVRRVALKRISLLIACLAAAGCVQPGGGLSGASSRSLVERRAVGDFSIEFANNERAVFVAKGREVALRPAPGFCISPESVDVGPASGFAMIGDCPAAEGDAALELPRAIPAILTVSIAEEAMFAPGGPRGSALSDLERFLTTPEGLATVGRSGSSDSVEILETRALGDALYVHVLDRDVTALPMFGEEFWRAFVELNGRLVLVSLSGFRDGPLEPDQMLAHLASQVSVLREANGSAVPSAEAVLAAGAEVGGGTTLALAVPTAVAPEAAPVAPVRPGGEEEALAVVALAGEGIGGETEGAVLVDGAIPVASVLEGMSASAHAPERAPHAPHRP